MKLNDIAEFLNGKIPPKLALNSDNIGFMGDYDLNQDIKSIKIMMDLYPNADSFGEETLVITHHPPLFSPKTPTFTIHSNWDIIEGGSNEALADSLDMKVIESFDKTTGIGRICEVNKSFYEFKEIILSNYNNVNIVNRPDDEKIIEKVGIISGFGLKNPDYIRLARDINLDMLISGDLTQESAVIAHNLDLTLIDLGHHNSEVPGLYYLKNLVRKLNIDCEVINNIPIENMVK